MSLNQLSSKYSATCPLWFRTPLCGGHNLITREDIREKMTEANIISKTLSMLDSNQAIIGTWHRVETLEL